MAGKNDDENLVSLKDWQKKKAEAAREAERQKPRRRGRRPQSCPGSQTRPGRLCGVDPLAGHAGRLSQHPHANLHRRLIRNLTALTKSWPRPLFHVMAEPVFLFPRNLPALSCV